MGNELSIIGEVEGEVGRLIVPIYKILEGRPNECNGTMQQIEEHYARETEISGGRFGAREISKYIFRHYALSRNYFSNKALFLERMSPNIIFLIVTGIWLPLREHLKGAGLYSNIGPFSLGPICESKVLAYSAPNYWFR
jgi:hypothetical protein